MNNRVDIVRRWLPEGERPSYLKDSTAILEDLEKAPVLILLGPPGSGKTDTVRAYRDRKRERILLKSFSDVSRKRKLSIWMEKCFVKDKTLILDAYDEKSKGFSNTWLQEIIDTRKKTGSLPKIRIVSRHAYLPEEFERFLKTLFETEEKLTYVLQPLDEDDIKSWVQARLGVQSEAFFEEVQARQLGYHLSRPADLESFIRTYQERGNLGKDPADAWRNAIRRELKEFNVNRKDRGTWIAAKTNAASRFALAEILAVAQTMCAPKPIVMEGVGGADHRDGYTEEELLEQYRLVRGDITEDRFSDLLRETVRTSLFEEAADGFYFASAAKAQFLAAGFLAKLAPAQLINLFKDAIEGKRVPKRARPVAAQIAKFSPELFNWICENHPEALLQGVTLDYDEAQRKQLTAALLSKTETRDPWDRFNFALGALDHPSLGEQLVPYLRGEQGTEADRYLAITIVDYCKCRQVAQILGEIAHDKGLDHYMRTRAAHVLADCGQEFGEVLRPFLHLNSDEDEDDGLYSAALTALWPHAFTPVEAFQVLKEPQGTSGRYHAFLTYMGDGIHSRVTPELIIPGLEWLTAREPQHGYDQFKDLTLAITELAWRRMDDEGVATALAEYVYPRLSHSGGLLPYRDEPIFRSATVGPGLDYKEVKADKRRRWILLRAVLDLPIADQAGLHLNYFGVAEELQELAEETLKHSGKVRELLRRALTVEVCQLIWSKKMKALKNLEPHLDPVGIKVSELRAQIRAHKQDLIQHRPAKKEGFHEAEHNEEIKRLLDGGRLSDFPRVMQLLCVTLDGWHLNQSLRATTWDRWEKATKKVKYRVLDLAKQLVENGPATARPENWTLSDPELAQIAGLILVQELDPKWIRAHIWKVKPWLPFVSNLRHANSISKHPIFKQFDILTDSEALKEVEFQIKWLVSLGVKPSDIHRMEELWRPNLARPLAQKSRGWSDLERHAAIMLLLMHQQPERLVELRLDMESENADRRRFAISQAVKYGITDVFPTVSDCAKARHEDFELTWDLIWNVDRYNMTNGLELMDPDVLERFFNRAVELAPPEKDIQFVSGPVNQDYNRQEIRNKFAFAIAGQLTEQAERFVTKWSTVKNMERLPEVTLRAKHTWLENSWRQPELKEIVILVQDKECRYIATQQDLLKVVRDALIELKPRVEAKGLYWREGKPALEPDITSDLAEMLKVELRTTIINAEPDCLGNRPDIQIQAIHHKAPRRPVHLRCILEVKIGHNRELLQGVDQQLIEKYLPTPSYGTGIYLVLWYEEPGVKAGQREERARQILSEQVRRANATVEVMHFNLKNKMRPKKDSC